MGKIKNPVAKGCAILVAVPVVGLLLVVGVVSLKTWVPLEDADRSLAELDQALGQAAVYVPSPSGAIAADRMELFLELRTNLVSACDEYGVVREGFDSVASLETQDPNDLSQVGGVMKDLGGASLSITPFLARFFRQRNEALLAATMGLDEYSYIYAMVYHDHLLSPQIQNEIFSDGEALSLEASAGLKGCLMRQAETATESMALEFELKKMENDPSRLLWQDGLPEAIEASVVPYRDRLDPLFCAAAAGLEMERDAKRAIRIALE